MQPSPHYDNAVAFVPLWARVRGFHSRATAVQDCDLVVAHLHRLGFVINKEKSVLCPSQITHLLGMFLDSTSMEVRLSRETNKCHQNMRAAVPDVVPVSEAQRSHRQAPQVKGVLQMQESPGNLESPLVSRCVRHYGHSDALRSNNHRRLHQGVGSGLRGERRERS